jgi:hypothetical protein
LRDKVVETSVNYEKLLKEDRAAQDAQKKETVAAHNEENKAGRR